MLSLFRRSPSTCIFCDIVAWNSQTQKTAPHSGEENHSPASPVGGADHPPHPLPSPPPPLATILADTPSVLAFADKFPVAKHHFLVIPKEHIVNAKHLRAEHLALFEEMTRVGKELVQTKIEDEEER